MANPNLASLSAAPACMIAYPVLNFPFSLRKQGACFALANVDTKSFLHSMYFSGSALVNSEMEVANFKGSRKVVPFCVSSENFRHERSSFTYCCGGVKLNFPGSPHL